MNPVLLKHIMKHFCFFALQSWLVLARTLRGHREEQEDWLNSRLAENQIGPKTWLAAKLYQRKRQLWCGSTIANPHTEGTKVCFCPHSVAVLQCEFCWTNPWCTWVQQSNRVVEKLLPKENSVLLIHVLGQK